MKAIIELNYSELDALCKLTLAHGKEKYDGSYLLDLCLFCYGIYSEKYIYSNRVKKYINKVFVSLAYSTKNKIIGWAAIYPVSKVKYNIKRSVGVYVEYKYRNKGIGTKLLLEIKSYADKMGYDVIPEPWNRAGIKVYKKAQLGLKHVDKWG